ncbi:MAG: GGDEF domain-containing protein [Gammaproteobacteria bacterium]
MAIQIINDQQSAKVTPVDPYLEQTGLSLDDLQRTMEMAGLLQTSLEVETVLKLFLESVHKTVKFGGAIFTYEPMALNIRYNRREQHRCHYTIRLSEEYLGKLTFCRRNPFTPAEMETLEGQMFHLIYPLRNALMYQKAITAAQIDPLTGANNRTAMDAAMRREIELSHRQRSPLSLLVLDLDLFKDINDKYGHLAGDYILKTVVTCLKDTMRSSDMLFRYGGEEFTLLLAGTDKEGAHKFAERVRRAVANYPFVFNGQEIPVTTSIGVASLAAQDNAMSLFDKADHALYCAKNNGRNQVQYYTPPHLQQAK